jgi:hypothetical protein
MAQKAKTKETELKYPESRLVGLKQGIDPIHEQPKTASFTTRLTPEGKQGFEELAQRLGLSKSEIIEKLARGEFELVPKLSQKD